MSPARPGQPGLGVLTAAKTVSNVALRWVGPFLPTLERAFGASTGTMTGIIGVAELGGLTTLATGPRFDRGHERTVFMAGMGLVTVSSAVALAGVVPAFAASFVLLVIGVGNLTSAGHAWIGHRVPYTNRSRAIGLFETSWAIAMLLGVPILALLIDAWGWRAAYLALLVASAAATVLVGRRLEPGAAADPGQSRGERLPRSAWRPMIASAATAAAGLGTFIVSGAWLDDAHGISTAGLGLVAAGFGVVELCSSTSVAAFADAIGARRSVLAGLVGIGAGIAVMLLSGGSQTAAVIGLCVFLAGFEYGFVSSLTLVSEAAPSARGKAIGVSNAIGTLSRAGAVVLSGQLYEAFGMTGTLVMASVAATLAMVMLPR